MAEKVKKMKIIAGLGNPGEQYKKTRHNAGFIFLDHLADAKGFTFEMNKKFFSEVARLEDTIYIKPQTFMNNSGQAIIAILSYYKLLPKKLGIFSTKDADLTDILTVIHDDIDIDLGKYKIASGSGSAGHRGIESIINSLKTKKFTRVRIGIKNEAKKNISTEKLVLGKFSSEETMAIEEVMKKIELK